MRESGLSPTWYAPVPQESMFATRGCAGLPLGLVKDWKTPSPIVERHIFPRQTKRTETGLGEDFESLIVTGYTGCLVQPGVLRASEVPWCVHEKVPVFRAMPRYIAHGEKPSRLIGVLSMVIL